MTRLRADMASLQLLFSGLLEQQRGCRCVLRSACVQSGPGEEALVRNKVREEGGGKVERNCPPSYGNELPGLASLAGAQPTGSGI